MLADYTPARVDKPGTTPQFPCLTRKDVFWQFRKDIFDKEVQSAATYSYLWMADQMGHVAIGMILGLFFQAVIREFAGLDSRLIPFLASAALATAIVSFWEWRAYRAFKRDAEDAGTFALDKLLGRNAVAAAAYMAFGGIAGASIALGIWYSIPVFALMAALSIYHAGFWLRQKIVWQCAGLPYLSRMSKIKLLIDDPAAISKAVGELDNLLSDGVPPTANTVARQVVISGPVGVGKTELAAALATEFAFHGNRCRYLTFGKLVETMLPLRGDPNPDDAGPSNILYWPWRTAQVLIIDDIDPGAKCDFMKPADFKRIMDGIDEQQRGYLKTRHTIWVLGAQSDDDRKKWLAEIHALAGPGAPEPIEIALMRPKKDLAEKLAARPGAPAAVVAPAGGIGSRVVRAAEVGLLGLAAAALVLSALWLRQERRWDEAANRSTADAFHQGTLGLELAPYKYLAVAGHLSAAAIGRDAAERRSAALFERYGFIVGGDVPGPDVPSARCPLPVGFTVSNLLPNSAWPNPVKFAGLACSACHSQQLRTERDTINRVIVGAGSTSIDLIGFGDALKNAIADPALTSARILDTYDEICGNDDGAIRRAIKRPVEAFFIDQWLSQFRATTRTDSTKYDMPFHGAALLDPAKMAPGPSRTRPFRSVVRNGIDFPGADNWALSKVPIAAEQDPALRPRSQYDGSIASPVTRSLIAAFTSGGSLEALGRPAIRHNVVAAAAFTETWGLGTGAPSYDKLFARPPAAPERLARGYGVYREHCQSCHGYRPLQGGRWVNDGADIGKIAPLDMMRVKDADRAKYAARAVPTDGERLTFRYAEILPDALWSRFVGPSDPDSPQSFQAQRAVLLANADAAALLNDFLLAEFWTERAKAIDVARRQHPLGHPLRFARDTLRYDATGYINNPIPLVYLRAPFLHNASIPTLRQLINLDERPSVFCRGRNAYDPDAVGLVTTRGPCTGDTPFRFDTTARGNSNAGHDFPWPYAAVKDDAQRRLDLEALLDYLKTL